MITKFNTRTLLELYHVESRIYIIETGDNDVSTEKVLKILALSVIGMLLLLFGAACASTVDNFRFQTMLHSADGKEYYITAFSDDETSTVNKAAGSEGAEGDVIYSGHYKFVVGTTAGKQSCQEQHISLLSEDKLSFNIKKTMFYVGDNLFPNQPDILFVLQSENSNNMSVRGYYIKNGKMQSILWRVSPTQSSKSWNVKMGYQIASSKPLYYTTSGYDNTKGGFIHRDWQLDTATDAFILCNTYFVAYDEELRGMSAKTGFVFPAAGQYESVERARTTDTGETTDFPLWKLGINKSNTYYGKVSWASKGVWYGNWTAPLSITANSDGHYSIDISDGHNMSGKMELQETSDGSLVMNIKFTNSNKVYSANMKKIE